MLKNQNKIMVYLCGLFLSINIIFFYEILVISFVTLLEISPPDRCPCLSKITMPKIRALKNFEKSCSH